MKPGTEITKDGIRYYINGERVYIADRWDAMFLPAVKVDRKDKYYKGENPCKHNELFYERKFTKTKG